MGRGGRSGAGVWARAELSCVLLPSTADRSKAKRSSEKTHHSGCSQSGIPGECIFGSSGEPSAAICRRSASTCARACRTSSSGASRLCTRAAGSDALAASSGGAGRSPGSASCCRAAGATPRSASAAAAKTERSRDAPAPLETSAPRFARSAPRVAAVAAQQPEHLGLRRRRRRPPEGGRRPRRRRVQRGLRRPHPRLCVGAERHLVEQRGQRGAAHARVDAVARRRGRRLQPRQRRRLEHAAERRRRALQRAQAAQQLGHELLQRARLALGRRGRRGAERAGSQKGGRAAARRPRRKPQLLRLALHPRRRLQRRVEVAHVRRRVLSRRACAASAVKAAAASPAACARRVGLPAVLRRRRQPGSGAAAVLREGAAGEEEEGHRPAVPQAASGGGVSRPPRTPAHIHTHASARGALVVIGTRRSRRTRPPESPPRAEFQQAIRTSSMRARRTRAPGVPGVPCGGKSRREVALLGGCRAADMNGTYLPFPSFRTCANNVASAQRFELGRAHAVPGFKARGFLGASRRRSIARLHAGFAQFERARPSASTTSRLCSARSTGT